MDFKEKKETIIEKYSLALEDGLVDTDMIPINDEINNHPYWVTTSSCSGRIILISKESVRSKYHTKFHFKSHQPDNLSLPDLNSINFHGQLWLLMEPPNIHIHADSIIKAKELVSVALTSKLGKSKYQSIEPNLVVEILGTASLQIPLGVDDEVLVEESYMTFASGHAAKMLSTEKKRLNQFFKEIRIR